MNCLIDGFGFSSYRSFGDNSQLIGPCSKINLLIGKNNSGKSNVLLFLNNYFNSLVGSYLTNKGYSFPEIDKHRGTETEKMEFFVGFKIGNKKLDSIITNLHQKNPASVKIFNKMISSTCFNRNTDLFWIPFSMVLGRRCEINNEFFNELIAKKVLDNNDWYTLWNALTGSQRGDINAHWIPESLKYLASNLLFTRDIILIPAIRRVGPQNNDQTEEYSGLGIIDRLAQLQNPDHTHQNEKQKFERINRLLQEVTDNASCKLEIPYERDVILVHMDGKTLPLSSLGTGIQELIILASEATVREDTVICIEEPELHMHPLLQKRLVDYLYRNTENQYFISTHSAQILDGSIASIFQVSISDNASRVNLINSYLSQFNICKDLGYKASDILQSNCIIWVEGPSDRIYLNHWIKSTKPSLIEGIHYTIMFYGGRLLSHLTTDDSLLEDFISLRKINMNLGIVIDSDKSSGRKGISNTKKRVLAEFSHNPGFSWLTEGREIENYIDSNTLRQAIHEVHPNSIDKETTSAYDDVLDLTNSKGKPIQLDKVSIAYKVVEQPANLKILDLYKKIQELISFIEVSNK